MNLVLRVRLESEVMIVKKRLSIAALSVLIIWLVGCSTETQRAAQLLPDLRADKPSAMVVTANPHASKAGAEILRQGGSAVDAAIAIEAVLSLVEPQSSGFGGGGYLSYFDNTSKKVTVYDGRETAPASISPTQFLNQSGERLAYIDAKNSGLSTGVPGMVAMLALAHADHGKLDWGKQFSYARKLAHDGFEVSPRLAGMLKRFGRFIPSTREDGPLDAYHYFHDENGEPLAAGAILKNADYVKTLDIIAADPTAFYRDEIATEIVEQVQMSPRAGQLRLQDIANYQAQKKDALCAPYKSKVLCGPPPSSSWAAVAMIMGILEHSPSFSEQGSADPKNWQLVAEAQRLSYVDRDHYFADDQFVNVPLEGLLNPEYLQKRAALISPKRAIKTASHGDPWAFQTAEKVAFGNDQTNDVAGTTHFVVMDSKGNVVSLTASVESIFGSTRMAGGMFLNNQLTDFAFQPRDENGLAIANRIEPNKRPRSSMSPTIVLDQNKEFLMATGSPGGNSIIAYTVKTLIGVLEWGLSAQEAVNLPNMVARGDKVRIEKDRASADLIQGLRDYGFEVKESAGENSGLSVIVRKADGQFEGGVDPRREGIVEVVNF